MTKATKSKKGLSPKNHLDLINEVSKSFNKEGLSIKHIEIEPLEATNMAADPDCPCGIYRREADAFGVIKMVCTCPK